MLVLKKKKTTEKYRTPQNLKTNKNRSQLKQTYKKTQYAGSLCVTDWL